MRADRILIGGASGSGKTTLASRIAAVTGIPHTEIDALHWHAGWTPNPRFDEEVAALAASDAWITEWQYPSARAVLAARAQLLVWVDPPRLVVLIRVVRRTLRRRLLRVPLWAGNVEPPLRTILTDPEHIVRWSMSSWTRMPGRMRGVRMQHPDLRVVRLRSDRDARRLVLLLAQSAGGSGASTAAPKRRSRSAYWAIASHRWVRR